MGWPVAASTPRAAQKPSALFFSFGIDPSMTRMNGSSFPAAASRIDCMNASPFSYASTGLCRITLGTPGSAPATSSSMLGRLAAVMAIVSPSQPRPAVIQTT